MGATRRHPGILETHDDIPDTAANGYMQSKRNGLRDNKRALIPSQSGQRVLQWISTSSQTRTSASKNDYTG